MNYEVFHVLYHVRKPVCKGATNQQFVHVSGDQDQMMNVEFMVADVILQKKLLLMSEKINTTLSTLNTEGLWIVHIDRLTFII